jgi:hypothetical protein
VIIHVDADALYCCRLSSKGWSTQMSYPSFIHECISRYVAGIPNNWAENIKDSVHVEKVPYDDSELKLAPNSDIKSRPEMIFCFNFGTRKTSMHAHVMRLTQSTKRFQPVYWPVQRPGHALARKSKIFKYKDLVPLPRISFLFIISRGYN